MTDLHPAPGFVMVEPAVPQEEVRESGLVVPAAAKVADMNIPIQRAILLKKGAGGDIDDIDAGDALWFTTARREVLEIAGMTFITYDMIVAWEEREWRD